MKNSYKILNTRLLSGLLVAFIVMVTSYSCLGQDTLVTRNGQLILGNVMEVTTTEIKYKKMEVADGPVYTERKSSIAKIKYKNGYTDILPEMKEETATVKKEVGNEDYRGEKLPLVPRGRKYLYGDNLISENQMHKMLLSLNNPEITKAVKSAKSAKAGQYMGFGAIPFAMIGVLGIGLSSVEDYPEESDLRKAGYVFLGSAAVFLGTSISFQVQRKNRNAKALRLYREKY